ncbi:hypothetical protein BABINDRAFT_169253 [Babjeviella inositovora NRRL Y-12698]|uniref:Uncharacterized protein n=1 Tax=Babjeviella inositovora NRRL Y-12698 TaxID=984486 RepID=A0A1E3QI63_9ASCO|nr:uncharacterized protein BABINDRAFT_169253 [Babjeviella inositovora NRRL Y-12698]ODQ77386.1 hypothetical protein BABINDRAFT_169253 [Babjeviella inositovora NRRL Y-12698]
MSFHLPSQTTLKLFKCSDFPTSEAHFQPTELLAIAVAVAKFLVTSPPIPQPSLFLGEQRSRSDDSLSWEEVYQFLQITYKVREKELATGSGSFLLEVGVLTIRLDRKRDGFDDRFRGLLTRAQQILFIRDPSTSTVYKALIMSKALPKIHYLVSEYLTYQASFVIKPVTISPGLISKTIDHAVRSALRVAADRSVSGTSSEAVTRSASFVLGSLEMGFDTTKKFKSETGLTGNDSLTSMSLDIPLQDFAHFIQNSPDPSTGEVRTLFTSNIYSHLKAQTAINFTDGVLQPLENGLIQTSGLGISQARFSDIYMIFQSGKVKFFGLEYELEWSVLGAILEGVLQG